MPKISVLMPVYKTPAAFLREAIDSVLAQSCYDFELLIVDDCPDDDSTATVMKAYSDPRIIYQRNKTNLGPAASRNLLLAQAQGEYVAILDSDDAALPERLAKQAEYLDTHLDVGVLGSFAQTFGTKKKVIKFPVTDRQIKIAMLGTNAIAHSTVMMRRSVLTGNRIEYDTAYLLGEDYALWARLINTTDFHNIPEILTRYRIYDQSFSQQNAERKRRSEALIRFALRNDNPLLAKQFDAVARTVSEFRLFNLPIVTVDRQFERVKVYLFGKIPLITFKKTRRLNLDF